MGAGPRRSRSLPCGLRHGGAGLPIFRGAHVGLGGYARKTVKAGVYEIPALMRFVLTLFVTASHPVATGPGDFMCSVESPRTCLLGRLSVPLFRRRFRNRVSSSEGNDYGLCDGVSRFMTGRWWRRGGLRAAEAFFSKICESANLRISSTSPNGVSKDRWSRELKIDRINVKK